MRITMLNISRKTETASRIELQQVAQIIKEGPQVEMVRHIRDVYHLMSPQRTDDGRVLTHFEGGIKLPRLCFAAEYENRDQKRRMLKYNGLVVLEINGLSTYEQAMAIRNKARRMPQTLLCFLGGSGKSVKIVCRGEQYQDQGCKRSYRLSSPRTAGASQRSRPGWRCRRGPAHAPSCRGGCRRRRPTSRRAGPTG